MNEGLQKKEILELKISEIFHDLKTALFSIQNIEINEYNKKQEKIIEIFKNQLCSNSKIYIDAYKDYLKVEEKENEDYRIKNFYYKDLSNCENDISNSFCSENKKNLYSKIL